LHKQGKKIVTISFKKEAEHLIVSVEDNGIGRQKSAELNAIKNKNHISFATEAIQNRVNLLNQYNQKNISIQYIDKTNLGNQSTGTIVVFEIPITY
jgi:LytS/YehU family sensor histidine kinase